MQKPGIWVWMTGLSLAACSQAGTHSAIGGALADGGGHAPKDSGARPPRDSGGHEPKDSGSDSGKAAVFLRSDLPQTKSPLATDGAIAAAVDGSVDFGFACYRNLRDGTGSVLLSPFSITSAMAMAWAGAVGTTSSEIAAAFHFGDPAETHAALGAISSAIPVHGAYETASLANAVWISPLLTPLPEYLDTLGQNYGAGVGLVSFDDAVASAAAIDGWVSHETRGTIPSLLSPGDLPSYTRMVLTNAAYLKAVWSSPFDPTDTLPGAFHLEDGSARTAQMMRQFETVRYVVGSGFRAAVLPYEGITDHDFEMVVVLPDTSLAALEPSLSAAWLRATLASMKAGPIDLEMPRFSIQMHRSLKPALSALGVNTAFSNAADFTGIASDATTGPYRLRILDVIHEADAAVNEAGTEASASTAVIVGRDASVSLEAAPPEPFVLDHPFLVLIRHVETGAVLFLGAVTQPSG